MINFVEVINKIPSLDNKYTAPESRKNTVAILGSSKDTAFLDQYMKASSDVTRHFIKNGYNVVHDCGSEGIMGQVYNSALMASKKDLSGKPVQSLAIVAQPLLGDENLKDCVVIGKACSEAERVAKFASVADNFVIFPGSVATLQETATLIQNNKYQKTGEAKKVILFGTRFWENFVLQYKKLFGMCFLDENPVGKLFQLANSREDVIKQVLKK